MSLTSHAESFQQHSWETDRAHACQNGYESRVCRRLAWLWDPCHEPFPTCLRLQTLSLFPIDLLLSSGQMPISVPLIVWFL